MSSKDDKRYRFGNEFEDIVQETQPERKWYNVDFGKYCTAKSFYIASAVGSFVMLIVLGGLNIHVFDACTVVNAEERCCVCLTATESGSPYLAQDSSSPDIHTRSFNNVFYGVIVILGALFGLAYVYLGVSQENRFLLFCMAFTQAIEVLRSILDLAVERKDKADGTAVPRNARLAVLIVAGILMIISWGFMRRVYKMFGWKIFRRGGARKTVREMYKMYQRFRACNLLDIQASVLLFLVFVFYLQPARDDGYWVFVLVFLSEMTASRYMVKYLKREDIVGAVLTAVCKLVAALWWTLMLAQYVQCYNDYQESRGATQLWWAAPYFPSLSSVAEYYGGAECLASNTTFDTRVLELIIINYVLAMVFRLASLVLATFVALNFHKGLRDVFYVVRRHTNSMGPNSDLHSDYVASQSIYDNDLVGEFSEDDSGASRNNARGLLNNTISNERQMDVRSGISDKTNRLMDE